MNFDSTLKISDLIMVASVLVSGAALASVWMRDVLLKRREQADHIRSTAGSTLARIERWEEIVLALYVDAQPLFVEVSESLAKKFDIAAARDLLWKELNRIRLGLLRELRDEEIETAYIPLCTFRPDVRERFQNASRAIKQAESEAFLVLLRDTQANVMALDRKHTGYQSAELGNDLRNSAQSCRHNFEAALTRAVMPIQEYLIALIGQSDRRLLCRHIPTASTIVANKDRDSAKDHSDAPVATAGMRVRAGRLNSSQ